MTTKYTPGPWKVGQGGGLGATTAVYQWYEKLTAELAADRAAIATLEGTIYR